MATASNQDQLNEVVDELVARVTDALKAALGTIDIGDAQALGFLSTVDDLASAPIGNLSALQKTLQIAGVAGRSVTGGSGSLIAEDLVGRFFAGTRNANSSFPTGDLNDVSGVPSDIYWCSGATSNRPTAAFGVVVHIEIFGNFYQIYISGYGGQTTTLHTRFVGVNGDAVSVSPWSSNRDTVNTTVDSNGFIKAASPIFRLANIAEFAAGDGFTLDGCGSYNGEANGVTATHDGVGVYTVSGSLGFSEDGWNIEIPQDVNGNRLCFVETETSDDGTITVRTFGRRFDYETAMIVAGDPIDIPDGRWIDLRLSMPDPEQPDEEEQEPAQ